jgi:hypothetical protein
VPYQSLQRIYGATPCLYHQILAANDLFNQTNRDYRAISDAYLAAINEASLQPCWTLTDEVKRLRDFARFRLMLVNMAIDDQIQAQYYRNTITFTPLQGAADAFLNDFAINANLSQACQAAHDYAAANPDAWNFMANWGYANPTFEAQDLCPGFRETTPTAAVIIRVDTTTLQVGDDLQIDGEVIGVGLPHYSLMIDEVPLATITYQNELIETATDARFELTSAVADGQTVRFTLRAKQPTTVRLALTASGEIQIPATGAYGWGSGSSEGLTITVQ